MDSPEAAVRAYFTALNGSDVEGAVAGFAEDGSVMADGFPSATGQEELRRLFTGIFTSLSFGRELHLDRITERQICHRADPPHGHADDASDIHDDLGPQPGAVGPPPDRFRVADRRLHVQPTRTRRTICPPQPGSPGHWRASAILDWLPDHQRRHCAREVPSESAYVPFQGGAQVVRSGMLCVLPHANQFQDRGSKA